MGALRALWRGGPAGTPGKRPAARELESAALMTGPGKQGTNGVTPEWSAGDKPAKKGPRSIISTTAALTSLRGGLCRFIATLQLLYVNSFAYAGAPGAAWLEAADEGRHQDQKKR